MAEKKETARKEDAAAGLPPHVQEAFAAGGSVMIHSKSKGTVFATCPEELPEDAFDDEPQQRVTTRLVQEPAPEVKAP